jgi:FkbM family methyltransferase
MKILYNNLSYIARHPLNRGRVWTAWGRFFRWQLGSRLLDARVLVPWVQGTVLCIGRGDKGLTQNIYCGLHDSAEMSFLLHALNDRDVFYDIGANAGSYTVLASGVKAARSVCFEPVPSTFARLADNVAVNRLGSLVSLRPFALGASDGEIKFTTAEDCINHVLAEGESANGAIAVKIRRLDDVVEESGQPTFIKIDVEGYESSVLAGGLNVFKNPALRAVIMEKNGSATRYGETGLEAYNTMISLGFTDSFYDPFEREIMPLKGADSPTGNVIFIRDLAEMENGVKVSPAFAINGRLL